MIIQRDRIVVGASAGGVEALIRLVQDLPPDLVAAIFIVVHFPSNATSVLPSLLNRAGPLPAVHAQDGDRIQSGYIYVAPPGFHLLVAQDRLRLLSGPKENGHRPAIDPLFRSAAHAYGRRVVGVILSGMLDDGALGLAVIKAWGGVAIVQDPQDALFDSMPRSAIAQTRVDRVLPLAGIAPALVQLSQQPVQGETPMPDDFNSEAEAVLRDKAALEQGERPGEPSMLTCPECGGVLWELNNNGLTRFRCHVGHAYSPDSLVADQEEAVEAALWSAHRALEERAALARRMAAQARHQARSLSESQFLERAAEASQHANILRDIILSHRNHPAAAAQPDGKP